MITFKSNLVGTATVKKLSNNRQDSKDAIVNFVELNPSNSEDIFSLKETCCIWGDNAIFANRINTNFKNYNSDNMQFFALTEQSQDFEKLNPNKILGLAQISKLASDKIFLDLLQTSPEHNYYASSRLFKNIGKSIVNSIKTLFPTKEIFVSPATLEAEFFYTKVGFRPFLGDGIMRLKK